MRRLASEVIRNLEMRVARLEKQTHQKIAVEAAEDMAKLTTAYEDELKSIDSLLKVLSRAQDREEMSLKVFLKCLWLKRANNLAQKLSKKLNLEGWEDDMEVFNYATKLRTKHGTEGIGRIFTMIAEVLRLKRLKSALDAVGLLAPFYVANDFMDLWQLILGNNGVSLKAVLDSMSISSRKGPKEVEDTERYYDEGQIAVRMEGSAEFTMSLGINLNQFSEYLVDLLNDHFHEWNEYDTEEDNSRLSDEMYDLLYSTLVEESGGIVKDTSASIYLTSAFIKDKIVGSYHYSFEEIQDDDYDDDYDDF